MKGNLTTNPSIVIQLATIAKSVPQVRSCIIQELISPDGDEHLPTLLTTTGIRTPKVEQILANGTAQINWWIEPTQDQFRLTGKVSIFPGPAFRSAGNVGT